MQATTIITPHEGSNKNEHFNDSLCVAHIHTSTYYLDFIYWIRTKKYSDYLERKYIKRP